ncbi:Rid family detoxifying hydrolase [Cupriavidus pinatubonensis]|uniref:2-iminobutanoate/2-iminopropanoate deaminase n=1 Tax=Cupriavidus pinatubonensis TaxID=248026 RepID=A0ABM8Y0G4_9BURK|nr:Rid family detoxifying hydrolase [Cupriavidus pinatubonensis]CAG9186197.1 2-iminobutanoate/2-iminopropanoate deaminase [Cupriavidus pinatubonensis]
MQVISSREAPRTIGPYSQAIASDDWIFTSGQIPLTASGANVVGSIKDQTEQVFNNLEAVLTEAGSSLAGVVSVTVFMTDLGEFAEMNEVFAQRFGLHRPARTTIQVAALPTGARVEINAVARRQA